MVGDEISSCLFGWVAWKFLQNWDLLLEMTLVAVCEAGLSYPYGRQTEAAGEFCTGCRAWAILKLWHQMRQEREH